MPVSASAASALEACAQYWLGDVTVLLVRDVPPGVECLISGEGFKLLKDHIPTSCLSMCVLEHRACEENHTEPGRTTEETLHGAGLCVMARPPAYWTHATHENGYALVDVTSSFEITSWLEEWMRLTAHDECKINFWYFIKARRTGSEKTLLGKRHTKYCQNSTRITDKGLSMTLFRFVPWSLTWYFLWVALGRFGLHAVILFGFVGVDPNACPVSPLAGGLLFRSFLRRCGSLWVAEKRPGLYTKPV